MKYLLSIIIFIIFILFILLVIYYKKQNIENYNVNSIPTTPILYFSDFKKGDVLYTSDIGLKTLKINENANFLGVVNAKKMLLCDNFTATTVNNINFLRDFNIFDQTVNKQNMPIQNVIGSEKINELNVQNLKLNPDKKINILPKGIIVMWHGSSASVPNGWVLCDGLNQTPDLKDRFIMSSGSEYILNNKGGEDSVVLSLSQIPSHKHNGGHHHDQEIESSWSKNPKGKCWSLIASWGESSEDRKFASCEYSGNTGSTGGDKPHENRPPYYALAFIMKK